MCGLRTVRSRCHVFDVGARQSGVSAAFRYANSAAVVNGRCLDAQREIETIFGLFRVKAGVVWRT